VNRLIGFSVAVGVVGWILLAIEASQNLERALFAYTGGFAFCVSTALGALIFIQIVDTGHVVWVIPLRRAMEAISSTLPIYLLLFLPIAFGHRRLHPWIFQNASGGTLQPHYEHARQWLEPVFFVIRAYIYLSAWTFVSVLLRRASVRQDRTADPLWTLRQRAWGAAMIPVIAFTLTFAAFDWFMALVPGFASDLYGVYFFAGGFVAALGLGAVLLWACLRAEILPKEVGPSHVSAVGRVLLTSVILWSYIAAVSLILIWVGNLPREASFYIARVQGGWAVFSWLLLLGHFLAPFLVLLVREWKRHPSALAVIGAWMTVLHALDVYWLVIPQMNFVPRPLDVGGFLTVLGFATAVGAWQFSRAHAFPIGDPNLGRALRYETE
jgi:hypothetical protein